LIKISSKGPVFFLQERVGYKEKIFKIYKFRTMKVGSSKYGAITIGNDVIAGQNVRFHSENHNYDDADKLIREQGVNRKGISVGKYNL